LTDLVGGLFGYIKKQKQNWKKRSLFINVAGLVGKVGVHSNDIEIKWVG
jgi:hypothetical protein